MRSRVQGRCTDCPHLYEGLPIEWKTFAEFREFAIKNGFRKNTSPDRKDPTKGYTADNVQFIPFSENYSRVRRGRYDDYADRGPEPEPYYSDADLGAVPYEPATDRPFDDVPF